MLEIVSVAAAIIMVILFVAKSVEISKKQKLSRSWIPVSATIVQSEVTSHGDQYYPRIEYKYAIDGKKYKCRRIRINESWNFSFASQAEEVIRSYKISARVTAYVNPENHTEAILEPGF